MPDQTPGHVSLWAQNRGPGQASPTLDVEAEPSPCVQTSDERDGSSGVGRESEEQAAGTIRIDVSEDTLCEDCRRINFNSIVFAPLGLMFLPCGWLEVNHIESQKATCPLCRIIWGMLENPWRQADELPAYFRGREADTVCDLRSGYKKPLWDYTSSERWHQFRARHLMSWLQGEPSHNTFSVGVDEELDLRDLYRGHHHTRAKSRMDIPIFPAKQRHARELEDPELIEAGLKGMKEFQDYMRSNGQEWPNPQDLGNINVFIPVQGE